MMKTAKQIQGDVYERLRLSTFASKLSGQVYRFGMRDANSTLEDAVVVFTTGTSDQIQEGVVTINIYVADRPDPQTGVLYEDGERCEEIEIYAAQWVEELIETSEDYLFDLQQTIYTEAEPDINQHFVVIKLEFKIITT